MPRRETPAARVDKNAAEQALRRIAPLDPRRAEIWRKMTPAQRLEVVFQAYQFVLEMVRVTERRDHPDMSQEELNWHITRRMQGDPSLGPAVNGWKEQRFPIRVHPWDACPILLDTDERPVSPAAHCTDRSPPLSHPP